MGYPQSGLGDAQSISQLSPVKSSPIDAALYGMQTVLDSLAKEVEVLAQQLQPVLVQPPMNADAQKPQQPTVTISEVENRIESCRASASATLARINRLTSNLRL